MCFNWNISLLIQIRFGNWGPQEKANYATEIYVKKLCGKPLNETLKLPQTEKLSDIFVKNWILNALTTSYLPLRKVADTNRRYAFFKKKKKRTECTGCHT